MPPPLGFNLAPRTHAPAPSLSLARSRNPSGPPSLSGASVASSEGRSSKASPRTLPTTYTQDEDLVPDSVPLLPPPSPVTPLHPVDPAAWAAQNAYPPYDEEEMERERERRGSRPRVQFAPDAAVALFDAEEDEEVEVGGAFEKPRGRELVYIVVSVIAVSTIGAAAVLATLYDWVL